MWGKLLGKGGNSSKYKLEVQVVAVEGLPAVVKYARVCMARSAKVAHTKIVGARGGRCDTINELIFGEI